MGMNGDTMAMPDEAGKYDGGYIIRRWIRILLVRGVSENSSHVGGLLNHLDDMYVCMYVCMYACMYASNAADRKYPA